MNRHNIRDVVVHTESGYRLVLSTLKQAADQALFSGQRAGARSAGLAREIDAS